ncbi:MAG: outer membrane protein assembly factor BamD [Pelagibacteraceae bacterium]|jgi:outer membrane protein assembly factor BamD
MKNIILNKNFIFVLLISFLIFSCSNNKGKIIKPETVPPLDILYKAAFKAYQQGKFSDSIKLFQKVEVRYSFSEWAEKSTMMIMYIYYDIGEYASALTYAKKFKNLYPSSKDLDYVDYIIALTFYEQISFVSRDQTYSKVALKEFKKILKKYPNSKYAEDSKFKIDLIYEQLAGKEMYIARYYMNKSKWIAAIKRLENVIKNYNTTIYAEEALHRLVEVYYKLGNIKQSKKYAAILGYNFNDGKWYKRTYKIVKDKDYSIEQKKNKRRLRDKIKNLFKFSK